MRADSADGECAAGDYAVGADGECAVGECAVDECGAGGCAACGCAPESACDQLDYACAPQIILGDQLRRLHLARARAGWKVSSTCLFLQLAHHRGLQADLMRGQHFAQHRPAHPVTSHCTPHQVV